MPRPTPDPNAPAWTSNWTATTGLASPRPVYVRVFDYPKGYYGNFHRHQFAQLVYSLRGVASVHTDTGRWLASPLRAVAIPSWENHRVGAEGNTLLHSVFIDPAVYPDTITQFGVLPISSLLHALIQEAGQYYSDYEQDSLAQRLLELIIALLQRCKIDARIKQLPEIKHPRIRKAVKECIDEKMQSKEIAARAAFSPRQFSRVFKADTGMQFKDWRALYQVQQGMRLLQQGLTVNQVADRLGFNSASAFIALFKRNAGVTPMAILQESSQPKHSDSQ